MMQATSCHKAFWGYFWDMFMYYITISDMLHVSVCINNLSSSLSLSLSLFLSLSPPSPSLSISAVEQFIRSKYEKKLYMDKGASTSSKAPPTTTSSSRSARPAQQENRLKVKKTQERKSSPPKNEVNLPPFLLEFIYVLMCIKCLINFLKSI